MIFPALMRHSLQGLKIGVEKPSCMLKLRAANKGLFKDN